MASEQVKVGLNNLITYPKTFCTKRSHDCTLQTLAELQSDRCVTTPTVMPRESASQRVGDEGKFMHVFASS